MTKRRTFRCRDCVTEHAFNILRLSAALQGWHAVKGAQKILFEHIHDLRPAFASASSIVASASKSGRAAGVIDTLSTALVADGYGALAKKFGECGTEQF